jgi:DNA-binding transcriptional LysR family regulator
LPPILKRFMKPDYGRASFPCQESVPWFGIARRAGSQSKSRDVESARLEADVFPGFFLYYPSRRQQPAALSALIDTLRQVGPS